MVCQINFVPGKKIIYKYQVIIQDSSLEKGSWMILILCKIYLMFVLASALVAERGSQNECPRTLRGQVMSFKFEFFYYHFWLKLQLAIFMLQYQN